MFEAVAGFADPHEEFERIVRRVFELVLSPGDAAIDVGAHVGKHTIPLALAVGPTGWIGAIEPLPWAVDRLCSRLELAQLSAFVDVFRGCAGRQPESEISFDEVADHPGWSAKSVRSEAIEIVNHTVRQTTVDDLAGDRSIRAIKIDVEGGELDVVQGAIGTLGRDRPVVHAELAASAIEANGWDPGDLIDVLVAHDYEVFDVLGNRIDVDGRWEGYVRSPGPTDHFVGFDLIAMHPDDPDYVPVLRCLLTSFGSERLDLELHRVPELITRLPDAPVRAIEPPSLVVDDAIGLPDQLIAGPEHPKPSVWPTGTTQSDQTAVLWTSDGAVMADFNMSTITPLDNPTTIPLPVGPGRHHLRDGHRIDIVISTPVRRSKKQPRTFVEFDLGSGLGTGLVRLTTDGRLESLWVHNGRAAVIDGIPCNRATRTRITLRRRGDVYQLDALVSHGRVTSKARMHHSDGTLSVSVGRRSGWTTPEPITLDELEVQASTGPDTSTLEATERVRSVGSTLRRAAKRLAHTVPGGMWIVRSVRRVRA